MEGIALNYVTATDVNGALEAYAATLAHPETRTAAIVRLNEQIGRLVHGAQHDALQEIGALDTQVPRIEDFTSVEPLRSALGTYAPIVSRYPWHENIYETPAAHEAYETAQDLVDGAISMIVARARLRALELAGTPLTA